MLKKRTTQAAISKKREESAAKRAAKKVEAQKTAFKRAETYLKEYESAANEEIRLKRAAKASGSVFIPAEARVAVVIRIRGIIGVAPKQRKILQLLRLRQINNAVFIKLNKATINMLRLVEPYVAYGYPSVKTIKSLVYKRGYGKVNGQRVPLSDNDIVDKALGKYDIICVEDLVHEIATVGDNFKQAANFLWPFKLTNPTANNGLKRKLYHYNQGGAAGNRGDKINALVSKMV